MAYFAALGAQINMTYVLHDIFILGKEIKIVGVVNHIIDRKGSEIYGFIYKIFTKQFCLQKFRKNYQIFTKLRHYVPIGTLRA